LSLEKTVIGRLQYDAMDIPINIEGVTVNPGDVIIADGDGVLVVPRDKAPVVAELARKELNLDKDSRRKLYDKMGWNYDNTVL